jgi:hypothetical protein
VTREESLADGTRSVDWERLTEEFLAYRADEDLCLYDGSIFEKALVKPVPQFARHLLEKAVQLRRDSREAVRALYGFLLEKRYQERLNLLHFAFSIFEEDSGLPEEIVARTPFPHEDGIPSFRYHGNPDSVIVIPENEA